MEYKVLSKYLIKRGYPKKHLEVEIDFDFLQKGLILDAEKGNILKIACDGKIIRATHGTKVLSEDEIEKYYKNSHWELSDLFVKDPLEVWNGPHSDKIRSLLDYFDIIVSLLFARCVDSVDEEKNGIQEKYSVYDDIYEGLLSMFEIEHFQSNKGGYYLEMKSTPQKYYYKCPNKVLDWLKTLRKQGKLLFLITGSYIDFASCTASYTLGSDWKDYFDIIITYAKKPGFFTIEREFIGLDGIKQTGPIDPKNLELGGIYANGNWKDLYAFLLKHSSSPDPKCLYIGDSVIQDVYAPDTYSHCETVAVCEELSTIHPDEKIITSAFWGSYFKEKEVDTIWSRIIEEKAKLSVPDLEYAAGLP
ncbi:5'-nucleotidase domain-containing protein 1-like [Harmonia axyridis]|uniref:5'-nucleotidase domain-containing protein 1-like n=1 Tax=Harmonia axyridis TaxID=115357 RepID=UPI001E277027|nr:5'-nucleotidase domain-containing protein 1-like [Harmonia axyridis]